MIELLHILSDSNIGGAGRALLSFLDGFDSDGFRVRVAVPQKSAMLPLLADMPVEIVPLACTGDRSLAPDFLAAAATLIHKVHPTILHTHAGLAAQLAGIYHRVPVRVATKHRVEDHVGALRRLSLPNAGVHWIAVSEAVADGLRASGVPRKWVHTVPNGVSTVTNTSVENLRGALGIPPAAPVYGMVGRLEPEKGVFDFLQAANLVSVALPHAHFLVVGAGSLFPVVKRATLPNLHVLGYRSDMSAVYATLDVLVNASVTEAASMSLLEGLAAGLAVIATAVGGTPELLGDAGKLFLPHHVGALCEAMLCFANPMERRRAGARARLRVKERYENRVCAQLLRELYLDFCGVSSFSLLRATPQVL